MGVLDKLIDDVESIFNKKIAQRKADGEEVSANHCKVDLTPEQVEQWQQFLPIKAKRKGMIK